MAAALLRNAVALVPGVSPDQYDIASAGTDPVGSLDGVAEVLREIGLGFEPSRRALVTTLRPPPDPADRGVRGGLRQLSLHAGRPAYRSLGTARP
jgi:hypothetical protein